MARLKTHKEIIDLTRSNTAHIERLADLLMRVDQGIEQAEKTLDRLQPPHDGKLGVAWVQHRGKTTPRMIRWVKVGKTRWRTEWVPNDRLTLRATQKGEFAENLTAVVKVLEELTYLFKVRGQILTAVANLKRSALALGHAHLDRVGETIDKLTRL